MGGIVVQAFEIMNSDVFTVQEADTVRSVIEMFIENGISGVPVINGKNEIVAYISDGDIMRFIGKHKDIIIGSIYFLNVIKGDDEEFDKRAQTILDLDVLSIGKKTVQVVEWDEEIENIAAILGKKQIKKLPVVRNGRLAGIISRGDVIRHVFKSIL